MATTDNPRRLSISPDEATKKFNNSSVETVPEKIFGYKILQESASQAKVPFEVGSFPVFLPENLKMTANREKPEQLTFFFFEEMPKPTKGTIYLDTSKKGVTKFKTRRHNSYRAEVTYNGVKYRKRSAERADCEQFLAQLAEKYEKGLL